MKMEYDDLAQDVLRIRLVRLRRLLYRRRQRGLLTDDELRNAVASDFWRDFGFVDAEDYLRSELGFGAEEADQLIKSMKEEKRDEGEFDSRGQPVAARTVPPRDTGDQDSRAGNGQPGAAPGQAAEPW